MRSRKLFLAATVLALAALCTSAQTAKAPAVAKPAAPASVTASGAKITVLDLEAFKKLLKPGSKPLMINFWATWCDPCRAEFPDLVKVNKLYKDKIDFVTVSLDDLADIETAVPKFLTQMKADMPAYLLHADDDAAIAAVSPDWAGNLPLTVLYKPTGEIAYMRKGPIHIPDVSVEIDKVLTTTGH